MIFLTEQIVAMNWSFTLPKCIAKYGMCYLSCCYVLVFNLILKQLIFYQFPNLESLHYGGHVWSSAEIKSQSLKNLQFGVSFYTPISRNEVNYGKVFSCCLCIHLSIGWTDFFNVFGDIFTKLDIYQVCDYQDMALCASEEELTLCKLHRVVPLWNFNLVFLGHLCQKI